MKIVIAFYRTRESDNARAIIGHETAEAKDIDDAIAIARRLAQTLDMPQQPDEMSVCDAAGTELYVHRLSASEPQTEAPQS